MSALLTSSDAARLLGVTPAAVRHMARRGTLRIDTTTPGGTRLFRRVDVDRLVAFRAAQKDRRPPHGGAAA